MRRWIKRLTVLLLLAGAAALVARLLRGKSTAPGSATVEPISKAEPVTSSAPPSSWPPFESSAGADWLPPVDGACPDGYPIKANDSSHIYHLPGGRFYERTVPERCYAAEEAAERDGYRRSKA